ncbi:MAG: hypothetical protein ACM677_12305 [Bacteroides sp.]
MNKELKNAVEAADAKAQYDECAKRLLGQKSILSYIFAHTIEAFQGMKPKEIIPYIEGEPYIGEAPVGERGITVGEAILVKTMNKNGFTAEQIAAATDKDVEEVEAILAGGEPVFA